MKVYETPEFKTRLSACKTLDDVFSLVKEFYHTDENLSFVKHTLVTSGIKSLIKTLSLNEKI